MTFSQAWDAGFMAVLIFLGTVFAWLGLVEPVLGQGLLSTVLMTAAALVLALAFVAHRRNKAKKLLESVR
jgi:heme A synthase